MRHHRHWSVLVLSLLTIGFGSWGGNIAHATEIETLSPAQETREAAPSTLPYGEDEEEEEETDFA